MSDLALLVCLGFVNWLATCLITESEMFRPLRDFVRHRYEGSRRPLANYDTHYAMPPSAFGHSTVYSSSRLWRHLDYFVHCHLCVGVWIGLAEAIAIVHPLLGSGVVGVILTALGIKALGHFVLEIVGRLQARP